MTLEERQELDALQEQCDDYEKTLHEICELLGSAKLKTVVDIVTKAQDKAFKALDRHHAFD